MKKFISILAMFFVFAVGIPVTVSAAGSDSGSIYKTSIEYGGGKRYPELLGVKRM